MKTKIFLCLVFGCKREGCQCERCGKTVIFSTDSPFHRGVIYHIDRLLFGRKCIVCGRRFKKRRETLHGDATCSGLCEYKHEHEVPF